jgi:hypothetical protein
MHTLPMTAWLSVMLFVPVQQELPLPKIESGNVPEVLVPPALAKLLMLDAEQRKKVDELEQAFQQERKTALMLAMLKVKGLMDKIERKEEAAPALAVIAMTTNTLLELKRTHAAYEKKVVDLLTDEQKAKFAAWQKLRPKEKRQLGRNLSSMESVPPCFLVGVSVEAERQGRVQAVLPGYARQLVVQ